MTNKRGIITALIAICLAVGVVSFKKDTVIKLLGGYTHKTVETKIDTVYKVGKIDTLEVFKDYIKTKGIILNPKPKIVYKYKYIHPISQELEEVDSIKAFKVAVNDSIIEGEINVINKFNGDLIHANIEYKPLFPKVLHRVDTIFVNKERQVTLSNKVSKFGIGAGVSNLPSLSVLGSFTTRNGLQFIYEYSKPVNTPLIPVKDIHSIKILYNF